MDVSQLPVTNVTNKENNSSLCVESDKNGHFEGHGHFKNVMNDVMAGDDANQDVRTDERRSSQTEEKADSEQEDVPVALPVITPQPQVDPETLVSHGDVPLANAEMPLPAEENPHLAWFNAASFSPPNEAPALPDDASLLAGMVANDATTTPGDQAFMIPPSSAPAAHAEAQPARADGLPAVALPNDVSVNKQETEASMEFFKDKLFSMSETLTRLEKNPNTDPTANNFNMVMTTASQAKVHTPPAPAAPMPPKGLELPVTVDSPEWGHAFSQQITWLGQQKIDRAVIKLNPQELGPLEVNIKLHKDDASLTITTHTQHVRDLIEQAIPRLRDMMSEQGINLSQCNIESNANQRQTGQQGNTGQQTMASSSQGQEEGGQEAVTIKNSRGLIDYFA